MQWLQTGLPLTLVLVLAASSLASSPRHIRTETQSMMDPRIIEKSQQIQITMHRPRRDGRVLLTNDQSWETRPGNLIHVYSSILYENGKFRLWYDLGDLEDRTRRVVCYAESRDGLHFTKPRLGLHMYGGTKQNNVVMPGEIGGCSVWVDAAASPEHRYKSQQKVYPSGQFHMYSSPNGIHWRMYGGIQIGPGGWDTQSIIFRDPAQSTYLMFTRFWHSYRHQTAPEPENYRCIRRLESIDLIHWNQQSVVMSPNDTDKSLYPTPPGQPPVDYYGAAVFPYGDLTVMLTQAFWHWQPRPDGQEGLAPASFDVRLAVSTDTKTFHRIGNWKPFMGPGPDGHFDSRYVWALPNPIAMGDELWFYYVGSNRDHDDHLDPHAKGQLKSGIGRAVLRRDGWVSADADLTGGQLITPPVTFSGNRLELNASTGGGGSIQVELLTENNHPIPGFSKQQCRLITGNSVSLPVSWNSNSKLANLAGKTIRLRFHLKDCQLYAFRFSD